MQPDVPGMALIELARIISLNIGDPVPVDELFDLGVNEGRSLEEMEAALIHASAKGWVEVNGHDILLTPLGYANIYVANDNQSS